MREHLQKQAKTMLSTVIAAGLAASLIGCNNKESRKPNALVSEMSGLHKAHIKARKGPKRSFKKFRKKL